MYGFSIGIQGDFEAVVARVTAELKKEGFGILADMNVQATLKEKLGVDRLPYRILGACNPPLAHQALTAERDIGLLLPCNVIVYQGDDPGTSIVAALDPVEALSLTGRADIAPLAQQVRARLARALEALAA